MDGGRKDRVRGGMEDTKRRKNAVQENDGCHAKWNDTMREVEGFRQIDMHVTPAFRQIRMLIAYFRFVLQSKVIPCEKKLVVVMPRF